VIAGAGYNPACMEVRVRERLVGALVLVALVVLLVPALLKGPGRPLQTDAAPETRSVEVTLDDGAGPVTDDALVPEPAAQPPAAAAARPAAPEPPAAGPEPDATRDAPAPPRAADPAPSRAVPADAPAWAVQLGAFATREKAEQLVGDLRRRGYAAFVLEYRAGGQVLHRVRVGPEQDRARAAAIADRLRKDGFQPVVAPHP
jgi:DedD protein